jgi:hypothetical protein
MPEERRENRRQNGRNALIDQAMEKLVTAVLSGHAGQSLWIVPICLFRAAVLITCTRQAATAMLS